MSKKRILSLLLFILFINCQQEQTSESRYNPVKAGAEITKTIDIGDKIQYDSSLTEPRVLMSYYNNNYYLFHNEKVNVLNGESLDPVDQFDVGIKQTYQSYNNYIYSSFAVFNNKMLFLYKEEYNVGSSKNAVFQTDLTGNNLHILDLSDDFNRIFYAIKLGYNSYNNRVWINCINFYEYSYDKNKNIYTKVDELDSNWCLEVLHFYNRDFWVGHKYFETSSFFNKELILEKYNISDYYNIIKSVNLYYLDIDESPYDLIFNDTELEILYNKGDKLYLSKLKIY